VKRKETPRRIRQHISIQQIGTETLVYDERRHKAFCLNQSSSVLWRLADGQHSVDEVRVLMSLELNAPVSEDFVLYALDELRRDGLLEPPTNVEAGPPISRRVLLQSLGVGGALLLPAVAAIVAPTAAQAYSGCFDCSDSQAVRARRQQQSGTQPGVAPDSSPQR
jgi:hypothetical protein